MKQVFINFDKMKEIKINACEVSRWSRIKSGLVNLEPNEFFSGAAQDKDAVLLDVRTQGEIDSNPVKGSVHVNYLSRTLADELEQLDPTMHYYVFCHTGRRSARVSVILQNLGFSSVFNLRNGLSEVPNL